MSHERPRFFATASLGTEPVLAQELGELGLSPVEQRRGGAAFGDSLEHAYRACLWSRVASRVLMPLVSFEAATAEALYASTHEIAWTDHLGPERTLAVGVAGRRSAIGPSHFVALKTKDAIVDRVRAVEGARPNIDKQRPDVRVVVHVEGPRVVVNLDLAGRGLHHRGLGRAAAPAPLRENLAAAVLRIAGWPSCAAAVPLCDPMCGSATLLVEAAGMARGVAPGLARDRAGLEGWRGHDRELWRRLRAEARQRRAETRGRELRLAGLDASPRAVETAREIVARAGFAGSIRLSVGELRDFRPPWEDAGLVVTNPPYGARLGEAGELGPLYELLGDVLRRRFPGWVAWILSGNRALEKRIGLRAKSKTALYNGPIRCRLLEIPISREPVTTNGGPAWRRAAPEARGLARRLRANARRLRAWAEREKLTCYRLYDSDIPEYNVAVDWYAGAVRVEEYARPRSVDPADAERRLRDVPLVVCEVLDLDPADVVLRVRRRLGPREQHERYGDRGHSRQVREGDLRFVVNLTDYLDTGLFLDDRPLRRWIRGRARDRDFLNLFAHTCAASVAAAAGGARSTTSVDLSRTYLEWGRRNLRLNGFAGPEHRLVRADALRYLDDRRDRRRFGLIFVAPPTRSRSKAMPGDFEIQRDHGPLLRRVAGRLADRGEILFSTNLRGFVLDESALGGLVARELTQDMIPPDFARRPRLKVWVLGRERSRRAGAVNGSDPA